ncbi:unnamed protein product [Arabidopsis halleri]
MVFTRTCYIKGGWEIGVYFWSQVVVLLISADSMIREVIMCGLVLSAEQ